jgi:hypothetical protein
MKEFVQRSYCETPGRICHRREQVQLDFLRGGTLAPFLRASERPMAIACFLLLTVPPLPPLPDFNVPRFLRRIALRTVFAAAFPYLAIVISFSVKNPRNGSRRDRRPWARRQNLQT